MATTRPDHDLILAILRGDGPLAARCRQAGLTPATYRRRLGRYLQRKLPPHNARVAARVGTPVEILRDRWI